jgi:ADP-heptose:LPS heptosyltransferase
MGMCAAFSLEKHLGRKVIFYNCKSDFVSLWMGHRSRPMKKVEPNSVDVNGGNINDIHRQSLNRPRIDLYKSRIAEGLEIPTVLPPLQKELPDAPVFDVCIFPFAQWGYRTWPLEKWHIVAESLVKRGVNVAMIIPPNRGVPESPSYPVIQEFNIRKVLKMISNAKLVISNESGPAHMAGILGVDCLIVGAAFKVSTMYGVYQNTTTKVTSELPCVDCNVVPEKVISKECRFKNCEALDAVEPAAVISAFDEFEARH